MLELLKSLPEETPIATIAWLSAIAEQCKAARIKGLGKQRLTDLLDNTRRLLALYADEPFDEQVKRVIRQTPVAALESQDERVRYLNAVNIVREGEPLPFQVDELLSSDSTREITVTSPSIPGR
ncbi:hypothetical protein ULF88_25855 [Halopseudomonas pachastrellae]|nr:hypothetical protein [Halopseudomonas pachastrellae]